MDLIEAFKIIEGYLPLGEGESVYVAWQTLKTEVLAQQTNNTQSDAITLLRRWVSNSDSGSPSAGLNSITKAWLEGVA